MNPSESRDRTARAVDKPHGASAARYTPGTRRKDTAIAAGISTAACTYVLWRLGTVAELPAYLYFGAITGPMTITDIRSRRLPNTITLTAYPVTLGLLTLAAITQHDARPLLRSICVAVAAIAFHLLVVLLRPSGLGLGDVKLAGIQALLCGWASLTAEFAALSLGFSAAALACIAATFTGRRPQQADAPLGLYIAACTFIVIF